MGEPLSFSSFFAAWDLFSAPTLAGVVSGVLLGWLGVYIVVRRMIFVSAALSQGASFGVALSFYVHHLGGGIARMLSPGVGSTVITGLFAFFLARPSGEQRKSAEARLAFLYTASAAGVLVLGTRIVEEVQDIESLLLGSAVVVMPDDFRNLLGVALPLLILHAWWSRGYWHIVIDREGAMIRQLPVRWLEVSLLLSIAIAISVTTRTLGALPVFALSVLPAAASLRIVSHVRQALWLSALFGGFSGGIGYFMAYRYSLPVGPSQAVVAAALVLLSWVRRPANIRPSRLR